RRAARAVVGPSDRSHRAGESVMDPGVESSRALWNRDPLVLDTVVLLSPLLAPGSLSAWRDLYRLPLPPRTLPARISRILRLGPNNLHSSRQRDRPGYRRSHSTTRASGTGFVGSLSTLASTRYFHRVSVDSDSIGTKNPFAGHASSQSTTPSFVAARRTSRYS